MNTRTDDLYSEITDVNLNIQKIERLGLLLITLIFMDFFYEKKGIQRLKSIEEIIDGDFLGLKIIESISVENKGIFESWDHIYQANENDILNVALNFSKYKTEEDFFREFFKVIANRNSDFLMSLVNIQRFDEVLNENITEVKRGRKSKGQFQSDMDVAMTAVIAGVLSAGKGKIEEIVTAHDVYKNTSALLNRSVSEEAIKKRCYEKADSEGAVLRKFIESHAKELFDRIEKDRKIKMPNAIEVYMVMFRLLTLGDTRIWTKKKSEEGIPILEYI